MKTIALSAGLAVFWRGFKTGFVYSAAVCLVILALWWLVRVFGGAV